VRECHGLGSVEPSYVGVERCALTIRCCCGGAVIVSGVKVSSVLGARALYTSGQVVSYCVEAFGCGC